VKPNASSASWGISAADNRGELATAIDAIHAEGHDAIVEPFIPGHDIEVCVITYEGRPFVLPIQVVEQHDPNYLRTYKEKRNLVDDQAYDIRPLRDAALSAAAERQSLELMKEYWPFDYGRFEFRLDAVTGALSFMEVNLNCNLWSRKTIAMAASQIGWSHAELIETILVESLDRHRLLDRAADRAAA
jgi:D-alanine-D-alanine ligase